MNTLQIQIEMVSYTYKLINLKTSKHEKCMSFNYDSFENSRKLYPGNKITYRRCLEIGICQSQIYGSNFSGWGKYTLTEGNRYEEFFEIHNRAP